MQDTTDQFNIFSQHQPIKSPNKKEDRKMSNQHVIIKTQPEKKLEENRDVEQKKFIKSKKRFLSNSQAKLSRRKEIEST
jgi:hypothetical protein